MAKAGVASQPRRQAKSSSTTRQALVEAAIDLLATEGFAAASARSIADRAGCNQALVFYHFGSVADLLLAALDEVSTRRMQRYGQATDEADGVAELIALAQEIFSEDLDNGYVGVLAQMIAGSASTPGLGPEVASRIAPWRQFAQAAIGSALGDSPLASVVPLDEAAHAVVALYLGLEMLSHLDGDRQRALDLFARAAQLATLFAALTPAKRFSARKEAK